MSSSDSDPRSASEVESDIATIRKFASSYRAYWGVTADGEESEPVKDRDGLRSRLHRQLPAVEKIMVRAGTNGFGFGPPPIARGNPPRIGIVAVAFADEDPVYGIGGGPPCHDEVLNRLEMTLGVLDAEVEETKKGPPPAPPPVKPQPKHESADAEPAAESGRDAVPVEVVEAPPTGSGPVRVFLHGVGKAWTDARTAGLSIKEGIYVGAALATIVGTLGLAFGWWG